MSSLLQQLLARTQSSSVSKPELTPTLLGKDAHWEAALQSLPPGGGRIPVFFIAHGSPMLQWQGDTDDVEARMGEISGPRGALARFLDYWGKFVRERYNPKAIVVISAHWDTPNGIEVTRRDGPNEILYDYYGFPPEMYEITHNSVGDPALAQHVMDLLAKAGISSRPNTTRGLDHGVFIPFRIAFPANEVGGKPLDIPIIEVSMFGSLSPQDEIKLGQALAPLRDEGILLVSGGLTIHNLRRFDFFNPCTCPGELFQFEGAIRDAISISDPQIRSKALLALTSHPAYRAAHPHPDHFVPLYVAAGAGEDAPSKVISAIHGCVSAAWE